MLKGVSTLFKARKFEDLNALRELAFALKLASRDLQLQDGTKA